MSPVKIAAGPKTPEENRFGSSGPSGIGWEGTAEILRSRRGVNSPPGLLSVTGESGASGGNPDGPREDEGVAGRGCPSPTSTYA